MRSPSSLTPRPAEHWPALTPSAEVAAVLGRHLGLPAGSCRPVRPARAQARSTVHFLGTPDGSERCRWVVKQPRTTWSQDDVASPQAAEREFSGLLRLAGHLAGGGEAVGVPTPIVLLPELGGFATAFVPGRELSDLVHTRAVLAPASLLDGVGRAADLLRVLHALEELPPRCLGLAQEADRVRSHLLARLGGAGLQVPPAVPRVLAAVPAVHLLTRQTWLHGDYTPANVLLGERMVVGIDVDLHTGEPEADLARFVAFTAGAAPFVVDVSLPEGLRRHRPVVARFLQRYGAGVCAPVFELRLLEQLAGRWLRLRQLAHSHGRPALLPMRLRSIDAQARSLLYASARRLAVAVDDLAG